MHTAKCCITNCSDEVCLRLGILLLTVTWLTRDVRFFPNPSYFVTRLLYIAIYHFIWSHCIWACWHGMCCWQICGNYNCVPLSCKYISVKWATSPAACWISFLFISFISSLWLRNGKTGSKRETDSKLAPDSLNILHNRTLFNFHLSAHSIIHRSCLRPRSSFPKEFTAESGGSGELWWRAAGHRRNRAQRSATVQHRVSLGAGPQDVTPAQVG